MLRWERIETAAAHESGKVMICGHTSQKSGNILDLGQAICIDTNADGREGWLTCLDVTSYRWRQANEAGDVRDGMLELR